MSICKDDVMDEVLTNEEKLQYATILEKINNEWMNRCKYFDFFSCATGKEYGTKIESCVIASFSDLKKSIGDSSFDAISSTGIRVEIKSIRMGTRGYKNIFLKDDDVPFSKLANASFQQVKPSCCDWFLFHALYANGSRLFLVPSYKVSSKVGVVENGKFRLGRQHRYNEVEGVVGVKEVSQNSDIYEIKDFDLDNVYNFSVLTNLVEQRLKAN